MVLHGTFTACSSGAVRNWSGTPKSGVFFPVGTFTEHSLRAVSVNVRTEKILRILEFRCSNYCTGTALLAVIVHVTTGADTASSGCPLSSPRTQTQYPTLSNCAKTILASQATSVASEYVFSLAGNLVNDKRTALKDKCIRVCILLHSWIKFFG